MDDSGTGATTAATEATGATGAATGRDRTRARIVEVAAGLLAAGGRDAVSTRAVALAASTQAPAIYRLFGDKDGLLDAVAEYGFASYLARKPSPAPSADPVADLRAGWDLHISFGLENPALFALMYGDATGRERGRRPPRRRSPSCVSASAPSPRPAGCGSVSRSPPACCTPPAAAPCSRCWSCPRKHGRRSCRRPCSKR